MTVTANHFDAALPAPLPFDDAGRVLLFAVRRMAAGGLDDAHAAHILFIRFRMGYRRPLVLLRALMLELSRTAQAPIQVAPCCCPRMTAAEATLIDMVRIALLDPHAAHEMVSDVAGTLDCLGALTTAQAVSEAFADGGLPLA
jgi:hypothetical protein